MTIIITLIFKILNKHSSIGFIALFSAFSYGQTDTALLRKHVVELTENPRARNYLHPDRLNEVSNYIFSELSKVTDTCFFQNYQVKGITYRNVVARINGKSAKRIVIGAHYDVCGNQPGADDNASGIAGLLELGRILPHDSLENTIELVAYTLEEPPFFRTDWMGSYVHAKSLNDTQVEVTGMISLEMIGYYDTKKGSQHYPLGFLKLFYGSKGDFITVVNKFGPGEFARRFTKRFKHQAVLEAKQFKGPKRLTGIDFSDHLNYWKFGYSALMLTDTAFYRNFHYHQQSDTIYLLNFARMKEVIDAVQQSLK
ncbi:MAG: M28 family peptidase [Fluviicola sp.]